jgi:uncharacterized integral membrane protein
MNGEEPEPGGEPTAEAAEAPPDWPNRTVDERRVFVGTGVVWGLVLGIVLAVVLLVLIAQNTQPATVEFLVWSFSIPLIVLILAVLVVGVVLDELLGLTYRARKRRTLRDRDEVERAHSEAEHQP